MNGKLLFLGLIIALAIVGLLSVQDTRRVKQDMKHLEVAAGNVDYEGDPNDPEPMVHCYPVPGPNDLDIRTRMDFEARTSMGWVMAPDEAGEGEFCLIESPQAVEQRLEEANAEP